MSPLSLIKWLLFATGSTFAILFSEKVHSGENAAFFGGSSNSRHKVLWAVGWQRHPLPALHCNRNVDKVLSKKFKPIYTALLRKLFFPFNLLLMLFLHCTLHWREKPLRKLSTLREGMPLLLIPLRLSLLFLPLWLHTSRYSKVSLMRHT